MSDLGALRERVFSLLSEVLDPEIPVLSIVDLGIVRDVRLIAGGEADERLEVSITPTYSGCPAIEVIGAEIIKTLALNGFKNVALKTVYSPAWSADFMSEEGREKLRKYGIAPPEPAVSADALINIAKRVTPTCPFCSSKATELKSEFGSTACKAMYYCKDCVQPFEYFKSF